MSGMRVLQAVLKTAGADAQLMSHIETDWSTATFIGARHAIRMCWEGKSQVLSGAAFIDALEAENFTIPGMLVADADLRLRTLTEKPEPRFEAEIGLLVLEQC